MDEHEAFKQAARDAWDRAAPGWDRHGDAIHRWLEQPTDAMIEMAHVRPRMRVLDAAAGAGDQTLALARRVGPDGHVIASDLSPRILAFAETNARRAGLTQVSTLAADAEDLPLEHGSFDAVVCRLGLMLCPRPEKAVGEMFRVLKPGGRACAMMFGRPEHTPCVRILMATACAHAGQPLPDASRPGALFSLSRPGLVDELFRRSGFTDVATTWISAPFRLPSVADYIEFVRSSASPVQQMLEGLPPAARDAAWREIEERLAPFASPEGFSAPNELALTTGRRP